MNTSTSVLWELIQNMNRNEKLYFKRKGAVSAGVKHPLYIKLFDSKANTMKQLLSKNYHPRLQRRTLLFRNIICIAS